MSEPTLCTRKSLRLKLGGVDSTLLYLSYVGEYLTTGFHQIHLGFQLDSNWIHQLCITTLRIWIFAQQQYSESPLDGTEFATTEPNAKSSSASHPNSDDLLT